ncbi:hypothetical protein, partial [Roseiflexus sp.]|uniref:hypothetical protein n=1 Tax=Roseiflexus sp. TaxID=2562120 RepID=UPI00398BAF7B
MRLFLLTGGLLIALAACGAPAATLSDAPAPATGEPSLPPSATPLPTGEPVPDLSAEPSPTPVTGTSAALPSATDRAPTPAATAAPSPVPPPTPVVASATPLPPPPQVTALALPAPEVQPPPMTIGEQAILPTDLLARLVGDLALRSGSDPSVITLVGAEAVLWNDGSLGCPQPGMVYPQVQIEGYRVILRIGDRDYDYRVG